MALPLLWLGAAALSVLTVKELTDDRKQQQRKRKLSRHAQKRSDLSEHDSPIASYPTDLLTTEQRVKPTAGSIVCCGIAGMLDHTGVWLDDETIVEVDGNGLVKPVSPERFLHERSGKQIFIACDSKSIPLALPEIAEKAAQQIFSCIDYHVIDNNCHQFVWQCINVEKSINVEKKHRKTFDRQTSKSYSKQNLTYGLKQGSSNQPSSVTTFRELSENMAKFYNRVIYWDLVDLH